MRWGALLLPLLVAACAGAPTSRAPASADLDDAAVDRAVTYAARMLGKPYRFGGAAPATGFDCSGLVYYSFGQAGVALPRHTEELRRVSRLVRPASLRRGDLLFFDHDGKKNSHVGIYEGDGSFVHAPSSGKRVRRDRLDGPHWRKYFSEARRVST